MINVYKILIVNYRTSAEQPCSIWRYNLISAIECPKGGSWESSLGGRRSLDKVQTRLSILAKKGVVRVLSQSIRQDR